MDSDLGLKIEALEEQVGRLRQWAQERPDLGEEGLAAHLEVLQRLVGDLRPWEATSSPGSPDSGLASRPFPETRGKERAAPCGEDPGLQMESEPYRAGEIPLALEDSRQREVEVAALLRATRAVLEAGDFVQKARIIYDHCKGLVGATSGYVALLGADGAYNEVLFLDAGGMPCSVDPELSMPIRGLRAEAYRSGRPVYDNAFEDSPHAAFLPAGHGPLKNVLFAPMVIKGQAVGLLGLANKPGDFTESDVRLAAGFGELAAIAFLNHQAEAESDRLLTEMESQRHLLQTIADHVPAGIMVMSGEDLRVKWSNPAYGEFLEEPYRGRPISGMYPREFIPDFEENGLGDLFRGVVETGRQEILTEFEYHGFRRGVTYWRAFFLPLFSAGGDPTDLMGVVSEITEEVQTRKRIEELNQTLQENIREISRRTLELEAANRELEAFSYSVSHDLRTPLRAIEGFSRMLLEDYEAQLDEEGLRRLQVIRSNTQLMGRLIDDLLSLSRLGRQELRICDLDLEEMVRDILREMEAQEPSRDLQLLIHAPLPPARGDRSLIAQVLVNLLANAVKFTRPRDVAIIDVGGWIEGEESLYFVKDNGVGFDMRYADKLFGVFQRLHRTDEFEGTGVGLAIVHRVLHRHGGRVWATSRPDEGATVYFTLPRKGGQA